MRSSTTKKPTKTRFPMKPRLPSQRIVARAPRPWLSKCSWARRPCHVLIMLASFIFLSCSGPAGTQKYEEKGLNPRGKQAGSAAHGAATQPTTQSSSGENYGEEVSRLVYEKDEIVSVLKNGMVVIAKRVPSPAVA